MVGYVKIVSCGCDGLESGSGLFDDVEARAETTCSKIVFTKER